MRIWIDTDVGSDVDDALTLAYALRHPELELVGVSTVFGDVALRSDIARALLECAGAPDVPVLSGRGVPMTDGRVGLMFGHEGKGILPGRTPRMRVDDDGDAETRVCRIGEAIQRARPDLLLEGMIPTIAEWNWYCDPLAVQAVLAARHAALPRVVPAEVTFRTALTEQDVGRLAEGDALARQLSALCEEWLQFLGERGTPRPRVALHDPLTAATLVEPGLCPFEERRVRVDDHAVSHPEDGPPNVLAATDVDNDALRRHLMDTWL